MIQFDLAGDTDVDRDILQALVKTVELKDHTTAAHTWRVALYTLTLSEAVGVPPADRERFLQAAVLHDVGKIDIPQAILAKPGPLSDEEYEVIKTHTVLGDQRLRRMGETDSLTLDLVRSHHERIDGSGYPDALAGDSIPLAARYFAVIDAFDAMTSIRAYRPLVNPGAAERALSELQHRAGVWYCPEAVSEFAALYRAGKLDWILHYFNDPGAYEAWTGDTLPDTRSAAEARERFERRPQVVVVKPRSPAGRPARREARP